MTRIRKVRVHLPAGCSVNPSHDARLIGAALGAQVQGLQTDAVVPRRLVVRAGEAENGAGVAAASARAYRALCKVPSGSGDR